MLIDRVYPRLAVEHVIIVLLAFTCAMLAWQNHQLKHRGGNEMGAPSLLRAGDVVPPVSFIATDGYVDSLAYENGVHKCWVLAVLRSSCSACVTALPIWADMVRRLPAGARLVGLSADDRIDVEKMMQDVGFVINVEVLVDPKAFSETYKVQRVPTTIVIGPGGRVLGAWFGPMDMAASEDIIRLVAQSASA